MVINKNMKLFGVDRFNMSKLFKILKLDSITKLKNFSSLAGIPLSKLKFYDQANIVPLGTDLDAILKASGVTYIELMLGMGVLNDDIMSLIRNNAKQISDIIAQDCMPKKDEQAEIELKYETEYGKLYKGDCISLIKQIKSDTVDLIFADPPFNLNKLYPSNINDNLKKDKYIEWCKEWAFECIRILKHGGSFFIWNLPKWNIFLARFLDDYLIFKHWISVDIKYSLPIPRRLYPSHYSLLYFCKGIKPNVFKPDRFPMPICPNCMSDLKDYGGYKDKMNPNGVNMSDVWLDIPPVRHNKYKKRNGSNELSIKLLDRIIELSTNEGDLVFDPFGGSGTTYAVSEIKKRKWIHCCPVKKSKKRA